MFRKDILPNTTEYLEERIKGNGLIEQVNIRFYAGVESSLEVKPYVLEDGRKPNHLFTYPNNQENFITGDNDYFEIPVTIEIENDDMLVIEVKNTDTNYTYTLVCDVIITYFEG